MPDEHDPVYACGEQEGNISALQHLIEVCNKEGRIHADEGAGDRGGQGRLQPHTSRIAMNRSVEVMSMVADTAMP